MTDEMSAEDKIVATTETVLKIIKDYE